MHQHRLARLPGELLASHGGGGGRCLFGAPLLARRSVCSAAGGGPPRLPMQHIAHEARPGVLLGGRGIGLQLLAHGLGRQRLEHHAGEHGVHGIGGGRPPGVLLRLGALRRVHVGEKRLHLCVGFVAGGSGSRHMTKKSRFSSLKTRRA